MVLAGPNGATVGVIGGTGRLVDGAGDGFCSGFRKAALGGSAARRLGGSVDLDGVVRLTHT